MDRRSQKIEGLRSSGGTHLSTRESRSSSSDSASSTRFCFLATCAMMLCGTRQPSQHCRSTGVGHSETCMLAMALCRAPPSLSGDNRCVQASSSAAVASPVPVKWAADIRSRTVTWMRHIRNRICPELTVLLANYYFVNFHLLLGVVSLQPTCGITAELSCAVHRDRP